MINKNKVITRVLNIGEKNSREIILDINNKENYLITKNGKYYCQLTKRNYNYFIININQMFYKDYADNLALSTNNITGEKTLYHLYTILNTKTKYYQIRF